MCLLPCWLRLITPDGFTVKRFFAELFVFCFGIIISPKYYLFFIISTISSKSGPNTIAREAVSRKVVVSANVSGRGLSGVVEDIQKEIQESVYLPEGYYVEYGGQFESEERASKIIVLISILSVIIIFILLYNQFKRVDLSMVVLLNLPLALIGGVWAIFFSGGILNIPAIIGFISLFGIATRNGLLLVDRYELLRRGGKSLTEVVIQGSLDRLNPILMTALTSGLALLPLVFNGDLPGNEIQSPLAKVILGGLFTFSEAITLTVIDFIENEVIPSNANDSIFLSGYFDSPAKRSLRS